MRIEHMHGGQAQQLPDFTSNISTHTLTGVKRWQMGPRLFFQLLKQDAESILLLL